VEGRIENPYEPSPFSRFNQVGIVHLLGEGLGFETIWVLTFFQTVAFLAADCWRMVGLTGQSLPIFRVSRKYGLR
jgi:hypothetical protein